jgi:integrase
MARKSSVAAVSANLPRWREGWQDKKTGKAMAGFWYIWHEGRQRNLTKWGAPRANTSKANTSLALDARSRFLDSVAAAQVEAKAEEVARRNQVPSVADVCDHFVSQRLPQCSAEHQRAVRRLLRAFCCGEAGTKRNGVWSIHPYAGWGEVPAANIGKREVLAWIGFHPNWGTSGRRYAIVTLKSAFSFAVSEETADGIHLLQTNPLRTIHAPAAAVREAEITAEQDAALRAKMKPQLLDLHSALWDLGCRPGELVALRRHHYVAAAQEFVLQPNEWKCGGKTGRCRYIALTPKWVRFVESRIAEMDSNEDGYVFLTPRGKPYSMRIADRQFRRVREAVGLPDSISLYSVRHGWITRALLAGAAIADVANAAGTSAVMIQQVYSKLHLHPESRRRAVLAVASK